MRVLVVHNRYRSAMPSGENRVVDDEVEMLREAGIEVETFFRNSDDIQDFGPLQKAALAISPTYNTEAVRSFRRLLTTSPPDIVHIHNAFPLISPWVVRVARGASIPVVQTVHNYRFACITGTHFRAGRVCHDCTGAAFAWSAVRHGCYRDSRPQSLSMVMASRVHRSTWDLINRYVAISDHIAGSLQLEGVHPGRITVKYNSVPDPGEPTPMGRGFLFASRLEESKGVRLLLEAWARSRLGHSNTLTIAGTGPLEGFVRAEGARMTGVRVVGHVADVGRLMSESAAVVAPAQWEEPFGLVVVEAMARGRAVVVTSLGAPPTLISDRAGWIANPDPDDLACALRAAHDLPSAMRAGRAARLRYLDSMTPQRNLGRLLSIYRHEIDAQIALGSASARPI